MNKTKQLNDVFERYIFGNKYKIIPYKELFDSSYQRIKRLFVLPSDDSTGNDNINSFKKYFLPRVNIENYNIEIDRRNFYDQAINDPFKKYDEVRKTTTGQGDDYTKICCFLDYSYFSKNYKLTATDHSK